MEIPIHHIMTEEIKKRTDELRKDEAYRLGRMDAEQEIKAKLEAT